MSGAGRGRIESRVTGVWPYLRYDPNDRVRAWGLVGYGAGDMTLSRGRGNPAAWRADLDMRLFVAGLRRAVLTPGEYGGVDLAQRADAFLVQMASAAVPDMAATQTEASRLRLLLEGSRTFVVDGRDRTLTPGLELGLRHDGGDAETGMGVEAGAGLQLRRSRVPAGGRGARPDAAHAHRSGIRQMGGVGLGAPRTRPGWSGPVAEPVAVDRHAAG